MSPCVGLPVGEQHHDPDHVGARALLAARRHRVGQVEAGADVGTPFDGDAVDAGQHGPAPRPDGASADHRAGVVREGHEREAIAGIQPLDQRGRGCLRVLDGAALHRAAHVHDQRDREARPREIRARGRPQRHAQVQRTSGGRQHGALGGRAHRQRSRGWRRQRRRVAIPEVADQVAVNGRDRPARQPRVQLRQRGASGAVGGGVARVRIQAHDRRRRRRRRLRDGGGHRRRAVGLGLGRAVGATGRLRRIASPERVTIREPVERVVRNGVFSGRGGRGGRRRRGWCGGDRVASRSADLPLCSLASLSLARARNAAPASRPRRPWPATSSGPRRPRAAFWRRGRSRTPSRPGPTRPTTAPSSSHEEDAWVPPFQNAAARLRLQTGTLGGPAGATGRDARTSQKISARRKNPLRRGAMRIDVGGCRRRTVTSSPTQPTDITAFLAIR